MGPFKPASVKPEWKWPAFVVEEGQNPPLKVLLLNLILQNTENEMVVVV